MEKDFDEWNSLKKETNAREDIGDVYFREREIWWTRLGLNVGYEQDGSGSEYTRPVLIIKKYNPQSFLVVPLSTTTKKGKYYFGLGKVEGKEATAIVSQIRLIDVRRLVKRIGTLNKDTFSDLISALIKANFGEWYK